MKPFWHEAPEDELIALVENKTTVGQIMNTYNQPSWCDYPEALSGFWGCWSLMDIKNLRKSISVEFCQNCDCFIKHENSKP